VGLHFAGFHKNLVFFSSCFCFSSFILFLFYGEREILLLLLLLLLLFLERECFIKTNYSPSNEKRKKEMYKQAIQPLQKKIISLITISSLLHLSRQISKLNDRKKKKKKQPLPSKIYKIIFYKFFKIILIY
jgi:hypothetical protein